MTLYVFSLGLVPVQDWIEKARRSRDLRAGSVWLSQVMAKLLVELRDRHGAEILLPRDAAAAPASFSALATASFHQALDSPYGIPNRASGYLEAEADEAVAEIFRPLQETIVQGAWSRLKEEFLNERGAASRDLWQKLWELDSFRAAWAARDDAPVSLLWAAERAAQPRPCLRENLAAADRLFAQVKRSRPVPRWPFGDAVGKCNQCGQREAVGRRTSFAAWLDWQEEFARLPSIARSYRLDPGERLCHVCLTRRMAGYALPREFPATGVVAARLWLDEAEKIPEIREQLDRLRATPLGELDLARALTAAESTLNRAGATDVPPIRRTIARLIQERNASSPATDDTVPAGAAWLPARPPSYLAALAFDGDSMGRLVRREPEHVANCLFAFAQSARGLIEAARGEAFYLAGDEGLALAPAAGALGLCLGLQSAFTTIFSRLAGHPPATVSVGLVFFEHTRPLAGALQACRAALLRAKAQPGKSSLGVAVETASGSRFTVAAPWGGVWQGFQSALGLVRRRRLATGWAHDVEAMLAALPPSIWRNPDLAAVREEARRLFARRYRPRGATAAARRSDRDERWDTLGAAAWWQGDATREAPPPRPEQFRLLAFLARRAAEAPPVADEAHR